MKTKIVFHLLSLSASLFFITAVSASGGPTVLKVGYEEYEPYQMEGNPARGIDVELTGSIIAKAGYRAEFIKQPWPRQIVSLQVGKLDILMKAAKNPERALYAEWSEFFLPLRVALMARSDGGPALKRLEDLTGQKVTIGVLKGPNFAQKYQKLPNGTSISSLFIELNNNLSMIKMLMNGRLTYILSDPTEIDYSAQKNKLGSVRVALELPAEESFLMVAKTTLAANPGLLDKLNKAIRAVKTDGTEKAIFAKYGLN